MKITPASLAGYILEEVLAYLVRMTGYDLLVDPTQDPIALTKGPNGLQVRGRGADHQVDVLGQLRWVPTFTFPLRLFIEAKFRRQPMGIPVVRNAIGAVLDINQFNQLARGVASISPKFHYAYAIFSSSGFADPAQDMALAHQISLIDLSGNEYSQLRTDIFQTAEALSRALADDREPGRTRTIQNIRDLLRRDLDTLPAEIRDTTVPIQDPEISKLLSPIVQRARETGELFVAMANGPYMLLLNARNPNAFVRYCKKYPTHKVRILLADEFGPSSPWTIIPIRTNADDEEYELSFRIPSKISQWIFESSTARDPLSQARRVKKTLLSNITVIRHEEQQDYLFRLEWDPEAISRGFLS
jgi:hypothetical protein